MQESCGGVQVLRHSIRPFMDHRVYVGSNDRSTFACGLLSKNSSVLSDASSASSETSCTETNSEDLPSTASRKEDNWMEEPLPLPSPNKYRLNKFVTQLHTMLVQEKNSGIVEWRKGLLVLHNTDAFSKTILPKYFNARSFKTFRRQLNYYGFIHVRSFHSTGYNTTAIWMNRELMNSLSSIKKNDEGSVLLLRRVESCETAKTTEGRRVRKEAALSVVEEDMGVNPRSLQLDQLRHIAFTHIDPYSFGVSDCIYNDVSTSKAIPGSNSFPLALPPPPLFPLIPERSHCQQNSPLKTSKLTDSNNKDKASAANLLLLLAKSS